MASTRAPYKLPRILRVAWEKQPVALVVILTIAAGTGTLLWLFHLPEWLQWAEVWDPALTIVTLLTALVVWLSEARREWEQGLPMELTVVFTHREASGPAVEVMRCDRAPMLDPEPRTFAMALGQQMSIPPDSQEDFRVEQLKYWPVPVSAGAAVTQYVDKRWVRHYHLTFALKYWPKSLLVNGERLHVHWDTKNDFGRSVKALEPLATKQTTQGSSTP